MLRNNAGELATFVSPTEAYNELGDKYVVNPGSTALIISETEYDLTFLSYGVVLFCSPDAEYFVGTPRK